jgi:hypothetical protein
MADGTIRQRCVEIYGYRQYDLDWPTIMSILAYGPTAGAEALALAADIQSGARSYIDESQLPGGSVQGLLEAVAAIPDPGQARRLVSEVAGNVQIFVRESLYNEGRLYLTMTYEHPEADENVFLTVSAHSENGDCLPMVDSVAHWLAKRLGGTIL